MIRYLSNILLTLTLIYSIINFSNVPKEPYEDYIDKEITIRLGAIRGHTPKPLTIKISEIIDEAIVENT